MIIKNPSGKNITAHIGHIPCLTETTKRSISQNGHRGPIRNIHLRIGWAISLIVNEEARPLYNMMSCARVNYQMYWRVDAPFHIPEEHIAFVKVTHWWCPRRTE